MQDGPVFLKSEAGQYFTLKIACVGDQCQRLIGMRCEDHLVKPDIPLSSNTEDNAALCPAQPGDVR